ncbi:terpene cyclase/mutase-related family protein [Populus alba x Populus x berolinensis]|uniref:Terpene cyclase/mutase-related family protein n=1 Tax=Populus alba x Populus x berolinensis TaxID=444605 RepID=A0AAD6PRR7_9ROSI|nr:terpene cyclase/mutase-related family protein [Populus alba x Populus x berolinensis]
MVLLVKNKFWHQITYASLLDSSHNLIDRFTGRLPGYIGRGDDRLSFCHVDDVVGGHIAAMDKGRLGERYLLTEKMHRFSRVLDTPLPSLEQKSQGLAFPLWVIEAYGWLSILLFHLTESFHFYVQRYAPISVHVLRHQWAYSFEKARIELDYNPRSLKEGLDELLPWLKSSGAITY